MEMVVKASRRIFYWSLLDENWHSHRLGKSTIPRQSWRMANRLDKGKYYFTNYFRYVCTSLWECFGLMIDITCAVEYVIVFAYRRDFNGEGVGTETCFAYTVHG